MVGMRASRIDTHFWIPLRIQQRHAGTECEARQACSLGSSAVAEQQSIWVEQASAAEQLLGTGFALLTLPRDSKELAWSYARTIFEEAARKDSIGAGMAPLHTVGQFTIPPPGAQQRDFQALHMDFGLPVVPDGAVDVARFTELCVARDRGPTTALTRIVSLRRLLGQRAWASPDLLLERLRRYGKANAGEGAEPGAACVEGIFARLVEAADESPTLPRSGEAGFLCGMEFDSLAQERDHFAERRMDLESVEERVLLGAGQLLLLDNLATAHGRLGVRRPLELHQLCVGFRGLDASQQSVLLRRVLPAFSSRARPELDEQTKRPLSRDGGRAFG